MQSVARVQVPAAEAGARKLALTMAVLVTALGVGAVAGGLFEIPALRAAVPRFVPIRLQGAIALSLLGPALALLLASGRAARWLADGLAVAAALLALSVLAGAGLRPPGTDAMNGTTALGVMLAAGAMLTCDRPPRGAPFGTTLALTLLGWTLVAWTAQRYLVPGGAGSFETLIELPPGTLSAHAAIAFVALGVGVLLARPTLRPMATILAPTPGGALLRGLLPAVTLAPTVLAGTMPLALPHEAWRDTGFALVITGTVAVLVAMTWRMAMLLNQFDAQRIKANRRLARAHRALDRLVARRTDELARSNAALESDRRQLEATLLSIGDAVIALDANGSVTLMNPMAECLTGVPQQEAIGRPWQTVVRDHGGAQVARGIAASIADGWPMSIPSGTLLAGPSGRAVPIDGGAAPVRDAQGRALGAILVLRDVTVQQETLQRIEASEIRYRQLFESSPQPILVHDEITLALLDVNAAALACYGYAREAMLALRLTDLLTADERLRLGREGLPGTALAASRSWRHRRRDGTEIDVQVVTHPQAYAGRQARVMSVTDVSAQTRMAVALRDADRRKDEFLAMLAHELRNPLAPILNASELLRAHTVAGPGSDALDLIRRQVRHLTRLVDDLLDVSRITQGKVALRPTPLRLQQVVTHAAETARPQLQARSQRLQMTIAESPMALQGDETRLIQVVGNLLSNAAKFSPPGATVRLSLESDDVPGWARITVDDPGIGIEAGMLDRVFDLFAQADRSLARAQGGLGIGLTLVRRLVALHGGTTAAASGGIGQGSRFTIRLPLVDGSASKHPAAGAPTSGGTGAAVEAARATAGASASSRVVDTGALESGAVSASPMPASPVSTRSMPTGPATATAASSSPAASDVTAMRGSASVDAASDPVPSDAAPSTSVATAVVAAPVVAAGVPTMPAGRPDAISGAARRVLVVDDNVDCADSLAQLLRTGGHRVETAYGARAALEHARTLRPDALIIDIGLPGMDGYALARALRSSSLHRGVLLVALTGYGQAADRRRSAQAGFDHHLVKPGDPQQLLRLLAARPRGGARGVPPAAGSRSS